MKKILLVCLLSCTGIFSYANPHQRDAIIHNHHMGNGYQQQQAPRARDINIPNRYGAVALGTIPGNPISAVGWGTNQTSERKAKKLALKNCQAKGAEGCSIHANVRNGCVAAIDRYRADGLVETMGAWGGGVTKTKKNALKRCEASDQKCEIVDVQCSMDERVWYMVDR